MVSGGPAVDPVIDNPSFSTPAFINRHSSIGIHQSAFINRHSSIPINNQHSVDQQSAIANPSIGNRHSVIGNDED